MTQNNQFSRIVVEPASNGYVIVVETEDEEIKYVYTSLRIAIRELKNIMKSQNITLEDE